MGYFLGVLNPAAFLSKIKKVDLRNSGSGNLGATNTFRVLGKAAGIWVMVFDIAKAFLAVKLAQHLFPESPGAGMLAGLGAVAGHVFPFYMKFKGGKGLAAYGGMVLAASPKMFAALLIFGVAMMFITNHGGVMQLAVTVPFPVLVWLSSRSVSDSLIALAGGALVVLANREVIGRAFKGTDTKFREDVKAAFSKRSENTAR